MASTASYPARELKRRRKEWMRRNAAKGRLRDDARALRFVEVVGNGPKSLAAALHLVEAAVAAPRQIPSARW